MTDYLLSLLFTGLRRQEAAQLAWETVDLKDRSLVIADPKDRQPVLVSLSDYLAEIFTRRREAAESANVFSGAGRQGYLVEPRNSAAKVIEASGVDFTIHDLRRTFIAVADNTRSLCVIPGGEDAHDVGSLPLSFE